MIPLQDNVPTRTTPFITVAFIALCVLVFLWQLSLGPAVEIAVFQYGAIPATLFGIQQLPADVAVLPTWATLVTSMFLHGGWMHLIGNMLYLWIFGNNVEDSMGHGRFIVFYILCGLAAAFSHAIPNAQSVVPMIGASGAISGVLGAYLLLYPRAQVLVAVPIVFYLHIARFPAALILALWFVIQIVSSMGPQQEAGVAWGAHVGGFVAGMVLIPFFKRRNVGFFGRGRYR
ncbi:MAG TPA: rhomboid family intramembrane serine protease [Gammaproteobacteria bacterium]|jgi:membrane associated rhomboid family serine protease